MSNLVIHQAVELTGNIVVHHDIYYDERETNSPR
jgi:hypothetical protein